MIYVIIGQCGSGKTTFVRNLISQPFEFLDDLPLPCTKSDDFIALGKYHIGKRAEGADFSFHRTNADTVINTLELLLEDGYQNIILEGQRVNNDKIFGFLASLHIPVKMLMFLCNIKTSITRLRACNSKIPEDFIRQTKLNALYSYLQWSRLFNGKLINTE